MLAALALSTQIPKIAIPSKAKLTLTADRKVVAPDQDPGYHAVLKNTGRETLRLLLPQDGSRVGVRNPAVGWTLPDLTDPMPVLSCGNTNPIESEDFFTLAPGASREIPTDWAGQPELRPGDNRVSFTFEIDAKRPDTGFSGVVLIGKPPREMDEAEARIKRAYAELTPISLRSNSVRVTLKATP